MKKILYITFYFEPDLSACSFRNTPLIKELAKQAEGIAQIDVMTTLPNRYKTFDVDAPQFEEKENYNVYRIPVPKHKSGMYDQILSFRTFYKEVNKRAKKVKYDMVVASSSRLFTAYLGYSVAKKQGIPLYLDIRDIFVDTLKDVLKNPLLKSAVLPVLKQVEKKTFNYAKHINLISEGFRPYFRNYNKATYTYFTNGIDDVFLEANKSLPKKMDSAIKRIIYAGNIGEGQGLHKIVPGAAKLLGNKYEFHVIGDGGAKKLLIEELDNLGVNNVILRDPLPRNILIEEYHSSDYLLVHLNDYEAFKKVLPSKIFELSMFNKPLLVGVNGYAREFVQDNLPDSILFFPGNVEELVAKLKEKESQPEAVSDRSKFISEFNRTTINSKMATSMLNLIK